MNEQDFSYLTSLAQQLGTHMVERGMTLATAESCTGGWIAKCITDVAGSSSWFERGFITYHNRAKVEMLGVSTQTLRLHGAVSQEVATEMVSGALAGSCADLAVAVTGIAGPGGGTPDKPVGTVWIAWRRRDHAPHIQRHLFAGDREQVRAQAVAQALEGLLENLG